jgi:hypothetical protein
MSDWTKLQKDAEAQGWTIEQTRRRLKWRAPDGKGLVVSSLSPSDHRALKNHISLLRRNGYVDEKRQAKKKEELVEPV